MGAQGETRSGVHCLGQHIDDLLDVFYIHFLAAVEVFYIKAGEAAGVFQASKAGAVGQQVGVCPCHGGCCA